MKLSKVADKGNVVRLAASGRLTQEDMASVTDAMHNLLGAGGYGRLVLLDMAQLEFVDSGGISWLLVRHKRCREAGGKLVFYSLQPMVLAVLKTLRLDQVFDIAEHETAALAMAEGADS